MESNGSSREPGRAPSNIRFEDDSNLTFVNYGPDATNRFAYRQEARLHNARRRLQNAPRRSRADVLSTRQPQRLAPAQLPRPSSLINPVSTYARDPFNQDILTSRQALETSWRSIFQQYFYLFPMASTSEAFSNPADAFLNAARASQFIYRSLVVNAVVTTEARRGTQASEAVFRNQALIIRDFRRLVDTYTVPAVRLSTDQFQHIFASAFSLLGHDFNREAGLNAVVIVTAWLMRDPQNQELRQSPITEWIWMLMPRPGPAFPRTREYQMEMVRKLNLILDFLETAQSDLADVFPPHVSRYMHPSTAIFKIITMELPNELPNEPYLGFYVTCLHRILTLLYKFLDRIGKSQSPEDHRVLSTIEYLAATCLPLPPPQCVALFLWCLLSNAEVAALNDDRQEKFFAWALKDFFIVHEISFAGELVIWLLHKSLPEDYPIFPTLNMAGLRARIGEYYGEDLV